MADKLLPAETGIREFFGKRYMWLLNDRGVLELHLVKHDPDKIMKGDER
jgi:hypothetical protein